ncbi:hypothetical protein GCM10011573_25730 [Enterococcus wangshanyuanii]|uniref:Uncharacterized protein n=1 Tax=Enterococcus wangshanyuanii TaxID=2005703 RepID=A0ABQ1PD84_9ENTE|nr:hypothetical protein GCM10011573_25730 [Enterococcus wangshanyuanii]
MCELEDHDCLSDWDNYIDDLLCTFGWIELQEYQEDISDQLISF